MPVTGTPVPSSGAAGTYATQSDLENRYGVANIQKWSRLDATLTTTDSDRIDEALDYADAEIHLFFGSSAFTIPFAGLDSAAEIKLREWAVILAGHWLYFSRGKQDDNAFGNKLTQEFSDAFDEMALYRGGNRSLGASLRFTDKPFIPVTA